MPLREDDFRRTCARFATGVAVATTVNADGIPFGLTVNSFTSVSLQPPLVMFCIDKLAGVYGAFMDATHYGINILRVGQEQVSERFAYYPGDRFEGQDWHVGPEGVPLLGGAVAWLACKVEARWDAGDHTVLLGRVEEVEAGTGEPLVYFQSRYARVAPQ